MTLEIKQFTLGALQNNTYAVIDPNTQTAVLVDPAAGISAVIEQILNRQIRITQAWITHAHFDHIAGLKELMKNDTCDLSIYLHPEDLPLWQSGAGSSLFGFQFNPGCSPNIMVSHAQTLYTGQSSWQVLHTPGHTPGHVSYYNPDMGIVFCGDVIFRDGVGRSDLPGGNHLQLINSIRTNLLTLPPHTRLLSGHGEETTVGHESEFNPFL